MNRTDKITLEMNGYEAEELRRILKYADLRITDKKENDSLKSLISSERINFWIDFLVRL